MRFAPNTAHELSSRPSSPASCIKCKEASGLRMTAHVPPRYSHSHAVLRRPTHAAIVAPEESLDGVEPAPSSRSLRSPYRAAIDLDSLARSVRRAQQHRPMLLRPRGRNETLRALAAPGLAEAQGA